MSVLTMDFGALPPEINSAKMYSGAGSGPMLAAAGAWAGLAAQMHSAGASYSSAISELEGLWTGASGALMAAAVGPYVAWMTGTAGQAEQAATQAAAAAGAYEAAYAMTVPPPVIAANRSLLAALVATNILGQNTPAIAAVETLYGEMWAQDAAAMYGYAGSSASASMLTSFVVPPQITNLGGQAAQAAAVAQSDATSAATNAQAIVAAIPTALQGLAAPAASLDPIFQPIWDFFGLDELAILDLTSLTNGTFSSLRNMENMSYQLGGGVPEVKIPWFPAPAPPAATAAAVTSAGSGLGGGAVSAGMGRATFIGAMSAPPSWVEAAPEARAIGLSAPGNGFGAVAESGAAGAPGVPGVPVGGMGQGSRFAAPRYGLRLTVMPRPLAIG